VTDEIVFGGDSTDIPNGTYPGKLKSITTKESAAFGEFRAWDFELDSGSIVGGASSMSTNAKSKGGRWIVALLGRKPEKGEKVGSAIIGKPCLVTVEEDANGWPKVTGVLPPLSASSGPGRPQTPEVAQVSTELDF